MLHASSWLLNEARVFFYKLSYDDLRKAVNDLCKIQTCSSADCECCIRIRELLCENNIVDFIASSEFNQQKMPVQTAMSDNFQGFSNFCRAEFGIEILFCVNLMLHVRLSAAYVGYVCF
jgi:hypothetical protein